MPGEPPMLRLLLSALGLTTVTVILHGAGIEAAAGRLARGWTGREDRLGRLGAELVMARLVTTLLLLHLAEAVVWALFYLAMGAMPDLEAAVYFSLTSYATLGYGDVVLAESWRLLGPLEAVVGGWMWGGSPAILSRVSGVRKGPPVPFRKPLDRP